MKPEHHITNEQNDTVVALSTPEGEGGLAVVRMSGPEAVMLAQTIFRCVTFDEQPQSHHAYHGFIVWPEHNEAGAQPQNLDVQPGQVLDEVIVLPMLAPNSYTGEDTIEFFCHGGRWPARLVMGATLAAGARPAGRGEFTRRAFLNGKLSLDQAEAVADLIHAEDQLAAGAALAQLRGGLDKQLDTVESPLRALLADLEGSLEFSEDEDVSVPRTEVLDILQAASAMLDDLIALVPAGRHLREGIQVVLAGPPNVGKSSLLNALLGQERVIVDHEAGTTRDVISVATSRHGTRFVLHDTAGLRPHGGRIEQKGMERTLQALSSADIVLILQEASSADRQEDPPTVLQSLSGDIGLRKEARLLNVLTKADLATERDTGDRNVQSDVQSGPSLTSAKTGQGLENLWRRIHEEAGTEKIVQAAALGVVLNSRHQYKLMNCRHELSLLIQDTQTQEPGDEIIATILARILEELGEVSGRQFSENLLDEVFARFCVGK